MNLKIKFGLLLVVLSALILAGCTPVNEGPVPDTQEDLEPSVDDESVQEEDDLDEIFEESNFDDADVEIGELI